MEKIYAALQKFISLSGEDMLSLSGRFEEKRFARKEFITRLGEVENYIYFLQEGVVKVGLYQEGREKILDFWFDNHFFSSYTSFLMQQPSLVFVQAITDCITYRIRYSLIQEQYQHSLLVNKIGRILAEHLFMHKTQREIDFLTKSATEQYEKLFNQNPTLIQRIPINQIASYLGIHPESLSRIRKDLNS